MHMRRLSREKPASAANFEEIIFIGNGILGLAQSALSFVTSLRTFLNSKASR